MHEGHAEEQVAARAPAAAPDVGANGAPALRAFAGAAGNAAMAAMVARIAAPLAREPAPAAVDEAEQRATDAVRAASAGTFMDMVRAVEGMGAQRAALVPKVGAAPGVDGRKLGLAARVLAVKDAPSTEAYVSLGQELEAAGVPLPQRDEVYALLGLTGLAAPSQIEAFATDVKATMGWLAQNKGFQARAARLVAMVDARLTAVGVPRIMFAKEGGPHELGTFDRFNWSIRVTPKLGELDIAGGAKEATSIITTFYHEARHAEQDFLLMRLVIAEHPEEIPKVLAPQDVMEAAGAMGAPAGAERALAERTRDSSYGKAHEEYEERRGPLREEFEQLQERGASKEDMQASYDKRWGNYEGQPHEADAFQVEKRLQPKVGGAPQP